MQAQEPELEMWPWDDGDREEGEEWFTPRPFEAAAAAEEYSLEDYEATAVIHPFGRGQFRTVAMHVVIPPIVLDEFLKGKDRRSLWTWPDDDDEHIETKKYSTASAAANVNCEEWVPKAHTSSSKMGGVKSPSPLPGSSLHSHVGGSCGAVGRGRGMPNRGMGAETRVVKAKVSGRGRAMRTRAEIGRIPLRKPAPKSLPDRDQLVQDPTSYKKPSHQSMTCSPTWQPQAKATPTWQPQPKTTPTLKDWPKLEAHLAKRRGKETMVHSREHHSTSASKPMKTSLPAVRSSSCETSDWEEPRAKIPTPTIKPKSATKSKSTSRSHSKFTPYNSRVASSDEVVIISTSSADQSELEFDAGTRKPRPPQRKLKDSKVVVAGGSVTKRQSVKFSKGDQFVSLADGPTNGICSVPFDPAADVVPSVASLPEANTNDWDSIPVITREENPVIIVETDEKEKQDKEEEKHECHDADVSWLVLRSEEDPSIDIVVVNGDNNTRAMFGSEDAPVISKEMINGGEKIAEHSCAISNTSENKETGSEYRETAAILDIVPTASVSEEASVITLDIISDKMESVSGKVNEAEETTELEAKADELSVMIEGEDRSGEEDVPAIICSKDEQHPNVLSNYGDRLTKGTDATVTCNAGESSYDFEEIPAINEHYKTSDSVAAASDVNRLPSNHVTSSLTSQSGENPLIKEASETCSHEDGTSTTLPGEFVTETSLFTSDKLAAVVSHHRGNDWGRTDNVYLPNSLQSEGSAPLINQVAMLSTSDGDDVYTMNGKKVVLAPTNEDTALSSIATDNSGAPILAEGEAPLIFTANDNESSKKSSGSPLPEGDVPLISFPDKVSKNSTCFPLPEGDVHPISFAEETPRNSSGSPLRKGGVPLTSFADETSEEDPHLLVQKNSVFDEKLEHPNPLQSAREDTILITRADENMTNFLPPHASCVPPFSESIAGRSSEQLKVLPSAGEGPPHTSQFCLLDSVCYEKSAQCQKLSLPAQEHASLATLTSKMWLIDDAPIKDKSSENSLIPSVSTMHEEVPVSSAAVDENSGGNGPDHTSLPPAEAERDVPLDHAVEAGNNLGNHQFSEIEEDSFSEDESSNSEPCTQTTSVGRTSEEEEEDDDNCDDDDVIGQRSTCHHSNTSRSNMLLPECDPPQGLMCRPCSQHEGGPTMGNNAMVISSHYPKETQLIRDNDSGVPLVSEDTPAAAVNSHDSDGGRICLLASSLPPPKSAQVAANDGRSSLTNQGESLQWEPDEQTLYFTNLPGQITAEDLKEMIESFGEISHFQLFTSPTVPSFNTDSTDISISSLFPDSSDSESEASCCYQELQEQLRQPRCNAYVRMVERSTCDWVISFFHDNPLDAHFRDFSQPLPLINLESH